jgi:hypothetical protein
MNDKIDQLALQATDSKGGLDRHKFAKLIIQECVLVECSLIMKSSKSEVRGMELLIGKIFEHFGVEE